MTPFRVVILSLIVGIGAAALMALRTPNPLPEVGYEEAKPPVPPTSRPAAALASGPRTVTPDGLTIIDLKEGTGPAVKSGDKVKVNYIGRLYNGGDEFGNSYKDGAPMSFTVGVDSMIAGFTEGVTGLKVGGKRELLIPPQLGYQDQPRGDKIPANSTLLFDVELMSID